MIAHNLSLDQAAELVNNAAIHAGEFPYFPTFGGRGIVTCGGGFKYFTNAFVLIKLLRHLGNTLPIELWGIALDEFPIDHQQILDGLGVTVRFPKLSLKPPRGSGKLQNGTRWQWVLKPYAITHSNFDEVIFIDSDSFPIFDPAFLFDVSPYLETGAVFWPDLRRMGNDRPIWDIMGVPYRDEPEFETGQMVINKAKCWEPLQLALWMNKTSGLFYEYIWGDKDTFRFAWHRFGRNFSMPPYAVQILEIPGGLPGIGVMCQHDFDGNRLFQHRNMAKWNLLAPNPKIPGYIFEHESLTFLKELRNRWNGRIHSSRNVKPDIAAADLRTRQRVVETLITKEWLIEDRSPASYMCCGPLVKWRDRRVSKPWRPLSHLPPPPTGPSGGGLLQLHLGIILLG